MRPFSSTLQSPGRPAAGVDHAHLAFVMAVGVAMAGLPILFHLVGQPLALAICVANAIVAARVFPADIPVFVFAGYIFQNLFVSLVSPNFADSVDLEPLKSYNFVTTIVLWLSVAIGYALDYRSHSPFVRRLIVASAGVLAIVGVYFVAGLAINPRNAAVYLRNIGLPILLFQMFLIVAARYELATPSVASAFLGLMLLCGYLELLAPHLWFAATNGLHYLDLAYASYFTSPTVVKSATDTGAVVTNVLDFLKTDFLNTSLFADLDLKVQRLQGPNFHPISFGYLLASFMGFAAAHGRWPPALAALPLLLQTSAKGPLVLVLASLTFCLIARRRRESTTLLGLGVVLLLYAAFAIQSGMKSGDYHVLGLLGGLNGFLKNPIGHTLAQGGNLSIADFAAIDWSKFQSAGAADVAVESAAGVMLYQLGLGALPVFGFYLSVAWRSWRIHQIVDAPALAYGCGSVCVILVNGVFQEEAYFAPLALGLVMAFAGLSLGAADRALAPFVTAAAKPFAPPLAPARPGQGKHGFRKYVPPRRS